MPAAKPRERRIVLFPEPGLPTIQGLWSGPAAKELDGTDERGEPAKFVLARTTDRAYYFRMRPVKREVAS